MRKVVLLFASIAMTLILSSQPICGFDVGHKKLLSENSSLAQLIYNERVKLNQYVLNHPQLRTETVTATIPVVVHIMLTGPANQSSYATEDAAIEDAIAYVNEVYAGTAPGIVPPSGGGAGDVLIRFALAKRTPTNECTNGIDRVNASYLNNYSSNGVNKSGTGGCSEVDLKNFARWDSTKYYNIWVVNKIDGQDGMGAGVFIAGFAAFPWYPAVLDGTVMLASQLARGKITLAHELGHALSLWHVFQGPYGANGCPIDNSCATQGDWVCDTDPITLSVDQAGDPDFSCRSGTNACTNTAYTNKTESNIMNYLRLTCGILFTDGQAVNMLAALLSLDRRASLLASDNKALVPPEIRVYNICNTPVFTTNNFTAIGVGKDGQVWVGSANQGLYKFDGVGWQKNPAANPSINLIQDIKADQFGGIWVAQSGNTGAQATTGGLNYYPDTSFTLASGATYYGALAGLPTRYAKSLFIDTTRTNGGPTLPLVWTAHMAHITAGVSTSGGLGRALNASSPFCNTYRGGVETTNGLGSCQAVGGDASEIWVYASQNFGESQILRYNATTPTIIYSPITFATPGDNNIFQSSSFQVKAIYFDKHGRKWIGLASGGVVVYDNTNWYRLDYPGIFLTGESVNTNAITGDQYGNVFIGTTSGLIVYRKGNKIDSAGFYRRYSILDQLPSNNIKGICVDTLRSQLLLATAAGVVFYNPSCSDANVNSIKVTTTVSAGDWYNPATWCNNALPDENTKVIIKHAVTVTINTTCKGVDVQPGGSVNVVAPVTLTVTSQ